MTKREISDLFERLFAQAQMQFGSAVASRWLHDGEGCPGCGRKIGVMKFKGKDTLSLNAFIYREHRVLIAYLLCGKCARHIFRKADEDHSTTTALHAEIE